MPAFIIIVIIILPKHMTSGEGEPMIRLTDLMKKLLNY